MARKVRLETDLGDIRSHTRKVFEEFAEKFAVHFAWGIGATGDHKAGKALDLMAYSRGGGPDDPGPIRQGWNREVATYARRNAKRLGIDYIIWDQVGWSNNPGGSLYTADPDKWRDYDGESHANHVHISFEERPPAYRPPSGGTPGSAITLPTSARFVPFPGTAWFQTEPRHAVITAMGKRLVATGCGRYTDGPGPQWTSVDRDSYRAWQRKCGYTGDAADGWPGETSWNALRVPNPSYKAPTTPAPAPAPMPELSDLEDLMAGVLPAQVVQVEGSPAQYAVTLTGAVHLKNPTHKRFLLDQGWITDKVRTISKAELADLLEKE